MEKIDDSLNKDKGIIKIDDSLNKDINKGKGIIKIDDSLNKDKGIIKIDDSLNKDKGIIIAEENKDASQSDSMEKTDPSLKKDEGISQDGDAPLREMEQDLAFHEDPRSPTSNGYLEAVVINKKRKIEEVETEMEIPELPEFEEPPRSFGGLDDIVNCAKQHKNN